MRIRLRPAHDEATLAELYAAPHEHARWPDHVLRVNETIALARELGIPDVIADLSCGDAVIARTLAGDVPDARLILGDLAPGYELHGPIEKTILEIPRAGLLICCETIEHLDCPDGFLIAARSRADTLVLSTPAGERDAMNREHYWAWDTGDVREMLELAAWEPVLQRNVTWHDGHGYPWTYQIWGCR